MTHLRILLVGAGHMAVEYAKVLSFLGIPLKVKSRSAVRP